MSAFGKKDFDRHHALALRDGSDWHKADIDVCTAQVRSKTTLITPVDPTKDQVVETRRVLREMCEKADRAIDEQTRRPASKK